MRRNKILKEFSALNCITNRHTLEEYVDFCLEKDVVIKKRKQTSSHHILPSAKTLPFREYSNLKENNWNKAELTYYDHYYAHFLLAKAINHIATYSAFCGMHKKDVILERLSKEDLISENEFEHIWKNRNQLISADRLTLIENDNGNLVTKAFFINSKIDWTNLKEITSKRVSGLGNPVHIPGVVDKIRKKKSSTFIDGKNLDTISAERAAETMKKEIILEDGTITTRYKENGKKLSHTLATTDLGKRRATVRTKRYYSSEDCIKCIS